MTSAHVQWNGEGKSGMHEFVGVWKWMLRLLMTRGWDQYARERDHLRSSWDKEGMRDKRKASHKSRDLYRAVGRRCLVRVCH